MDSRRQSPHTKGNIKLLYLLRSGISLKSLIYQSLQKAEQQLHAGVELDTVLAEIRQTLTDAGFVVDYVEVRTPELQKIHTFNQDLVLFIAAKLGNTRLIDNLQVKYTAG